MKTTAEQFPRTELKIAKEIQGAVTKPTVCLVIKNEILRAGASCYLGKKGFDIIEASGSADEIAELAHDKNVAVIISDQSKELLIELGRELSSLSTFKSIVAINVSPDEQLLHSNVRVFLSNPFSPDVLLLGVQSALESSYFFPVNKSINSGVIPATQCSETNASQISGLSDRELQVLRKLASGLSNKELGAELFVTEDTVKSHLHNLLRKLGVKNRTQLVAKFLQASL